MWHEKTNGIVSPPRVARGGLVRAASSFFDPLVQGELITTDAMFGFAINGKGFFKVRDTRAGAEYPIAFYSFAEWSEIVKRLSRL